MGILKTLVQVLIVFSILVVAFAFAFYILMSGEESPSHQTIGLSMLSVFVMMLGNIYYIENWVRPFVDPDPYTMHFSSLSFLILVAFIVLIAILLMNLLIGLAVGDIESVQRNARLRRLAMQVDIFTELERKLSQRFLEFVDKTETKHYPNMRCHRMAKFVNSLVHFEEEDSFDKKLEDPDVDHKVYMFDEFARQRKKIDKLQLALEKQFELVRLVVQKMEIKSEDDGVEDDDSDDEQSPHGWGPGNWRKSSNWQKTSIINFWKREVSAKKRSPDEIALRSSSPT